MGGVPERMELAGVIRYIAPRAIGAPWTDDAADDECNGNGSSPAMEPAGTDPFENRRGKLQELHGYIEGPHAMQRQKATEDGPKLMSIG